MTRPFQRWTRALGLLGSLIGGECLAQTICEAEPPGVCRYAAPDGDGDGSISAPASLADALAQARAGDVVYLLQGTYTEMVESGGVRAVLNLEKHVPRALPLPTAEAPLIIKGYPSHQVVLQGDFSAPCVAIDRRSHYRFEDFAVRDCLNNGILLGLDIPGSDIVFRNLEISGVRYVDNAGFLTIAGYADVLVEGVDFHDYETLNPNGVSYFLKLFRARDVTIRGNRFHGEGGGIYYKHGEDSPGAGGRTRIIGNHFHDLSSGRGISLNQNRSEVIGNLLEGADIGLHFEDGTRSPFTLAPRIAYNTLVDSRISLNEGSASYLPGSQLGVFDARLERNLLVASDLRIWHYGPDSQHQAGVGLQSTDNCYLRNADDAFISYFGAGGSWGAAGGTYRLADWQAEGFDAGSLRSGVALDAGYRPPAGHPCKDMGHLALARCQSGEDAAHCDGFESR
ncbi:right-handed parallel beta-helix repeat-containing protein [Pseudomarimonas salicorniae]|uniref:Right-handed parallel beta-helix repeat-containing protein n=1 Tax=Pseudomarimonas salicorniae TaxID=2933270 RepID=A0ABT0GIB5_9GAMM|nr:right-handed parallel beta-helix repeat-containing protein [Lysobacter sp. CAU 1642]MCK7594294.1 right-handed parallel beta-helix repeat-containing protein [Lysobacter sp. CAU 1642]